MHTPHTFPTAAGPRLTAPPRIVTVPMTPSEAHGFAAALDHRAELLLAQGQREPAERLSWRAATLREAAR